MVSGIPGESSFGIFPPYEDLDINGPYLWGPSVAGRFCLSLCGEFRLSSVPSNSHINGFPSNGFIPSGPSPGVPKFEGKGEGPLAGKFLLSWFPGEAGFGFPPFFPSHSQLPRGQAMKFVFTSVMYFLIPSGVSQVLLVYRPRTNTRLPFLR